MSENTHNTRRKRGVCIGCGVNPPREGRLECQTCADKRAARDSDRYAKKRPENIESIQDGSFCEETAWDALKHVVSGDDGWIHHIVGKQGDESYDDLRYKQQSSEIMQFLRKKGGESSSFEICRQLKISWSTVARLAKRMIADGFLDWKKICNGPGRKQLFLILDK